jgi:hypothetical protein
VVILDFLENQATQGTAVFQVILVFVDCLDTVDIRVLELVAIQVILAKVVIADSLDHRDSVGIVGSLATQDLVAVVFRDIAGSVDFQDIRASVVSLVGLVIAGYQVIVVIAEVVLVVTQVSVDFLVTVDSVENLDTLVFVV